VAAPGGGVAGGIRVAVDPHPSAAGRTYAAYGGVYVVVALLWLWRVDGIVPTRWDLVGGAICLAGMAIIALQPRAVG
jgi:small multidrug resistance family-3 protein